MKAKYVVRSYMLDRDEYGHGMLHMSTDDILQWLSDRGIETETQSVYNVATMCYHVHIIAEFDRETYIEYKMVWE